MSTAGKVCPFLAGKSFQRKGIEVVGYFGVGLSAGFQLMFTEGAGRMVGIGKFQAHLPQRTNALQRNGRVEIGNTPYARNRVTSVVTTLYARLGVLRLALLPCFLLTACGGFLYFKSKVRINPG